MSIIETVVAAAIKTIVEHMDAKHGHGRHWTGGYLLGRVTAAVAREIRRRRQVIPAQQARQNVLPIRRRADQRHIGDQA